MDVTARLAELLARPDDQIPLDEAVLLVAAHAHPDLDVAARIGQLEGLAARATSGSAADLAHALFVDEGFRGNVDDYGDPRNSFLDDVLDRRLGIPISLSVVMLEVGRRAGLSLHGVGMPGHFLVGGAPGEWFDPFHAGARLDFDGCAALFTRVTAGATLSPAHLAPVGPGQIVQRILSNLQRTYQQRDPSAAVWVARLRLQLPGVGVRERADLAALLGRLGQFADAARELDQLAQLLPGEAGEQAAAAAAALRARAN